MLTAFSHGCLAPDYRHDSFVEVVERLSWLSRYCGRNVFCTAFA